MGGSTGASCTESALNACLPGGGSFDGTVTFSCGGAATITVTSTKTISADTTIDGGSLITISGGNSVSVFSVNSGVNFAVENLTIADGYASGGTGGGISTSGGRLMVINSTLSGNSAPFAGGGIFNYQGTLTVTNSTFSGNSASGAEGGGIFSVEGTGTVTNSTFSGNGNFGSDGGIYNGWFNTLTVTNSTFSGNSNAMTNEDGIYNVGRLIVTNTIVANSTWARGNCLGTITDGGHNLDSDGTCGVGAPTDPLLDPAGLQNNGGPTQTVALCTGTGAPSAGCTGVSPAINAGDESVCAAPPVNNLDQRGFVRPGTGAMNCSIGAFEANRAPCVANCSDGSGCTNSSQCTGGECDSTALTCCGQTADCNPGTSCTTDSQCRSGRCAGGVCAWPTPTPTNPPTPTPTTPPTPGPPAIPTLSNWGIIGFSSLAFAFVVWAAGRSRWRSPWNADG